VVLSLDCGGLERVVLDLVKEGRSRDQQVAVACVERPGALAPQVEALGAPVVCVHKGAGLRPGAAGRLRAVLRELRTEVVHTHQIGALFYAGPAARGAGVPAVVHTEHGKHYGGSWRRRWLGWLAARFAARFFCVSHDIARGVIERRIVPPRKVTVVPNGIDVRRFREPVDAAALRRSLRIPAAAPVIGTVGRLSEVKQQDVLLRAFARVRLRVPEAHLLLVGDGPLKDSLSELAVRLGLGDRVHFAGYQARPQAYLRLMDLFALTSRSEGMPLVVLEAWAAGLPVVASRVGGLPEMIDEGRTGVLFAPGDEGALADVLSGLLEDAGRARRMGEEGRVRVESRYTTARMFEEYQHHYSALLPRAGKRVG
jgi:glycosyltransferase involved in cell wall biosynthesis